MNRGWAWAWDILIRSKGNGHGHSRRTHNRRRKPVEFYLVTTELSHQLSLTKELLVRRARVTLGSLKWNCSWQYLITFRPISVVLKSFTQNLFTTKSKDGICDLFSVQATNPYRSMGTHFTFINWSVTSSDASQPTLPKTALATL